jgi:hypothetical protein
MTGITVRIARLPEWLAVDANRRRGRDGRKTVSGGRALKRFKSLFTSLLLNPCGFLLKPKFALWASTAKRFCQLSRHSHRNEQF